MNANDNSADDLGDKVMEIIKREEETRRETEYRSWCDDLASLPEDLILKAKNGFIADVELQPQRWIQHGLNLLGSRKAFGGSIQLFEGKQGPDFSSYLPYPVFQMGAEVFLKGMWLYAEPVCRGLKWDSYLDPQQREAYLNKLMKLSPSHDLLKIMEHVQTIDRYAQDAEMGRFLKIVGGVVRRFYFPVSSGKTPWAHERYPKRFYNDSEKVGRANAMQSYPEHEPVIRLFNEAARKIEFLWRDSENDL